MARTVPHSSGEGFHVVEHTNIGVDDDDLSSPHIVSGFLHGEAILCLLFTLFVYQTSWSACLDDQVGLENPKGGILIEVRQISSP